MKILKMFSFLFKKKKIKGNINSNNQKIYHVPGGFFYDKVKAEKMFYTEEEAIAAGYRKSKR
jgi:hypothetical protein